MPKRSWSGPPPPIVFLSPRPPIWRPDGPSIWPPARRATPSGWLNRAGTAHAVDFSEIGLDKGRQLAETRGVADRLSFETADLRDYVPELRGYDLVALFLSASAQAPARTDLPARGRGRGARRHPARGGARPIEPGKWPWRPRRTRMCSMPPRTCWPRSTAALTNRKGRPRRPTGRDRWPAPRPPSTVWYGPNAPKPCVCAPPPLRARATRYKSRRRETIGAPI